MGAGSTSNIDNALEAYQMGLSPEPRAEMSEWGGVASLTDLELATDMPKTTVYRDKTRCTRPRLPPIPVRVLLTSVTA